MAHITITIGRDADPTQAGAIVAGLRGMAAKEAAYARYLSACEVYMAAEDAACGDDPTSEALATWHAADNACQTALAEWKAI